MAERGVFAIDRSVFDHPIFAPEPFTEREAWLWMIGAAAWKPMRVRVGRAPIELERGQLAFATRFLATKWRWSEARVRRFLKRLEIDAMIATQTTHQATLITLCNYDKFAFGRRTDDAPSDAQTDAEATRSRRKEEEPNNSKKDSSELRSAEAIDPRTDLFNRGRQTLERITGKTPDSARALIGRFLKLANDEAVAVLGAIEDAERNKIADPVPWISRALGQRARGDPGRPGYVNLRELAARMRQTDATAFDDPGPTDQRSGGAEFDFGGGAQARSRGG